MMGQVERAMNRLYGIESDRPTARKYAHAFLLALTAGTLSALALVALGLGGVLANSFATSSVHTIWVVARWPLGIALLVAAMALLLRWAPRRHQPAWSWMSFGAIVAVGLLVLVTVVLNVFFRYSTTFGSTYGPLAGIIALALWAYATSIAFLVGAALAAQLEAVRASRRRTSQRHEDRRVRTPARVSQRPEPAAPEESQLMTTTTDLRAGDVAERIATLRRGLEGIMGVPATEGNSVEVLRNGIEIFPAMLDSIAGAKRTVDLLTFVYWQGEVGRRFAQALSTSARTGVRVRVLLDGWGAMSIEKTTS